MPEEDPMICRANKDPNGNFSSKTLDGFQINHD